MKRTLEINQFYFTKELVKDRLNEIEKKWNKAYKNNCGMDIIHSLKVMYYDLTDINIELFSMKMRKF